MSEAPSVQRCPHCGEQPMSRLQYAMVPGVRSKCRRCGQPIRIALTRLQVLTLVLLGATLAAVLTFWVDSPLKLVATLLSALLVAGALDQWTWHRLPWLRDQRSADMSPQRKETAAG